MPRKLAGLFICRKKNLLLALLAAFPIILQAAAPNTPKENILDKQAYQAFAVGNTKELKTLRAKGGNPARYAKNSPDAIYDATSSKRDISVLKFVLKSGANPNESRYRIPGYTPLSFTTRDYDKSKLLLRYGADPNIHRDSDYPILAKVLFDQGLSGAKEKRDLKLNIVRLLIEAGAKINTNHKMHGQWGALAHTKKIDKKVIAYLIKRGATLDYALGKNTPIVELTVLGREPTKAEKKYRGPLTLAADFLAREDLLLALLGRDEKISDSDQFAIIAAVRRGWPEAVSALLKAGADPNVVNLRGMSALAMASRRRDSAMTELLLAAGAKQTAKLDERKPKFQAKDPFINSVVNGLHDVAIFDPPRFYPTGNKKQSFLIYQGSGKQALPETLKINCERSVKINLVAYAHLSGSVSVGVCNKSATKINSSISKTKIILNTFSESLKKSGGGYKAVNGKKVQWPQYTSVAASDGSNVHLFPMIIVDRGLFELNTAVIVSKNKKSAIVVQADLAGLCGKSGRMRKKSPLCLNTNRAISDLAVKVFSKYR